MTLVLGKGNQAGDIRKFTRKRHTGCVLILQVGSPHFEVGLHLNGVRRHIEAEVAADGLEIEQTVQHAVTKTQGKGSDFLNHTRMVFRQSRNIQVQTIHVQGTSYLGKLQEPGRQSNVLVQLNGTPKVKVILAGQGKAHVQKPDVLAQLQLKGTGIGAGPFGQIQAQRIAVRGEQIVQGKVVINPNIQMRQSQVELVVRQGSGSRVQALVHGPKASHGGGGKLSADLGMESGQAEESQKYFFHGLELDVNFGFDADFENNGIIREKLDNAGAVLGRLHGKACGQVFGTTDRDQVGLVHAKTADIRLGINHLAIGVDDGSFHEA